MHVVQLISLAQSGNEMNQDVLSNSGKNMSFLSIWKYKYKHYFEFELLIFLKEKQGKGHLKLLYFRFGELEASSDGRFG